MTGFRGAILALLLPTALPAQAALRPPIYRGFSPGMAYRDFAARARALYRALDARQVKIA